MQEYKTTVHKDGKVVIPIAIRKKFDINMGDDIFLTDDNNKIYITTLEQKIKQAQDMVVKLNNKSLVDELIKLRKSEKDV